MKNYDLIVIGMGPAGMTAVGMGSKLGLKVLGIEREKVGGECLNVGCIPSKALLKAAKMKRDAAKLSAFGLFLEEEVEVKDPLAIVRERVASQTGAPLMARFESADVLLGKGPATFIDEKTVLVDGERYIANLIFIATGTTPMIPPIEGIDRVEYLTNVNVFDLKEIPGTLTIIGGGVIGVEMAQAFNRLGSEVTIVHMDDHLLPSEDAEAAAVLEERFTEEGIAFFNGTTIRSVEEKDGQIITVTEAGTFTSDKLLVAAGRRPALEGLDLEAAKIHYDKSGVLVDAYNRTNQRHVYAVGDVNGKWLLTHAAMHQAMISLMQAMSQKEPEHLERDRYVVPTAVYSDPEVAQVGYTESAAKRAGFEVYVIKELYATYARAVTDGAPEGFVKVVTDDSGRIYGATVVGEQASELIGEWTLAMQHQLGLMEILMTQHAFPTLSVLNKNVAEKWMMRMASQGKLGALLG